MDTGKPFTDFSFHDSLQTSLDRLNFKACTPIQAEAMPHILKGSDVAGLAQTGTGKTAAFMLPMIERIIRSTVPGAQEGQEERVFTDWQPNHFALVLVPTRELAEQVKECSRDFLQDSDHRVVVVYGGMSIEKQTAELEKGFTFLVATPGRLIDHYKRNRVDLKQVRAVIFDEADRMFDMGFKDDMKYILKRIPDTRQLLMFSATLNLDVFNVAYQFGSNPVELNVSLDQPTAENVVDYIFHLGTNEKPQHLLALFKKESPNQVIIFTNFKSQVDRISEFLNKNGYKAVGISSLMNQNQRQRVMGRFRSDADENILVATDVAARGLDIEGVDMVVNFELPEDAENYVHRIGRTGRAGEKGKAFSFVSDKDVEALDRIYKYIDRKIDTEWMESDELPEDFKPFPSGRLFANKNRTQSKPQGGRRPNTRNTSSRRGEKSNDKRDSKRGDNRDDKRDDKRDDNRRDEVRTRSKRSDGDSASRDRDGNRKRKVHRDRASGRHQRVGREETEEEKSSSNKKRQHRSRPARDNKSKRPRRIHNNYPKKSSTQKEAPKPSLIGRVGSAIKKLFG